MRYFSAIILSIFNNLFTVDCVQTLNDLDDLRKNADLSTLAHIDSLTKLDLKNYASLSSPDAFILDLEFGYSHTGNQQKINKNFESFKKYSGIEKLHHAIQNFRPTLELVHQKTLISSEFDLNSEVAVIQEIFEEQHKQIRSLFHYSVVIGFEEFKFHQNMLRTLYIQHCKCSECKLSEYADRSILANKCKNKRIIRAQNQQIRKRFVRRFQENKDKLDQLLKRNHKFLKDLDNNLGKNVNKIHDKVHERLQDVQHHTYNVHGEFYRQWDKPKDLVFYQCLKRRIEVSDKQLLSEVYSALSFFRQILNDVSVKINAEILEIKSLMDRIDNRIYDLKSKMGFEFDDGLKIRKRRSFSDFSVSDFYRFMEEKEISTPTPVQTTTTNETQPKLPDSYINDFSFELRVLYENTLAWAVYVMIHNHNKIARGEKYKSIADMTKLEIRKNEGMIHYEEVQHCKNKQLVKQCLCSNGVEARGFDCPFNDAPKCVSCYSGFHLSNNGTYCYTNKCICDNGKGTTGVDCQNHDQHYCLEDSCDDGYIWENGRCILERSSDYSYSYGNDYFMINSKIGSEEERSGSGSGDIYLV